MAAQQYSRLAKIEEAKARRTVIVYSLLTLGIVLFILFFGVRILTAIAGFIQPPQKQSVEITDTVPPPPPQLDFVQQKTNKDTQVISGESEPESIVQITVNGSVTSTRADAGGNFTMDVMLSDGDNTIAAKATDAAGNVSNQSDVVVITLDKTVPTLTITKPSTGQSFTAKDTPIRVEGITDAERVTVNDRIAVIDGNGKFSLIVSLNEGQNDLVVQAIDQAGNKTETTINVTYTP